MMENTLICRIYGGVAALLSAGAWALTTILFRKLEDYISPIALNLAKCVIGVLYLGIFLFIFGVQVISNRVFLLLGFSGLLGIALGDTFYFKALLYLGPSLTVILSTLGPAFTLVLAVYFLKEKISFYELAGIILILTGISGILWEDRKKNNFTDNKIKRNWFLGIIFAILSALCMAIAVIFSKLGVIGCSAIQATFIRILWSALGLSIWGFISGQLKSWIAPIFNPKLFGLLLINVFIAIFGGFYLFLFSLKYINASLATILGSTAPLFVLPLSIFMLKEKINFKMTLAAIITVAGITLIFWN